MRTGRIAVWNDAAGYGFIVADSGRERVFVHISGFAAGGPRPLEGDSVTYVVGEGRDGRPAAAVIVLLALQLVARSLQGRDADEQGAFITAFDGEQRLRLVNRSAERLLDRPAAQLLGRTAEELHMQDCLEGEPARTLQRSFPGGFSNGAANFPGRWGMRRSAFREEGKPHQLVVIADLSRALREEERLAWQRLVRVLGHELNNSLTPIKSIARSLEQLLTRQPRPSDWEEDVERGLSVISTRAEALNRFMTAYAKLAKLPRPDLKPMEVSVWVRQVVGLETRMKIALIPGPELTIQGDRDQLEQLLINLVRNAVDAAGETGGGVSLPVWISFMETALKGVPVMEPAAPEGVVNVGGEWYYDEYARGAGVSSVGLEDKGAAGAEGQPAKQALPPADEKKGILDLFRN